MKNLITIIAAFTLTATAAFASTTPETVISTENVIVVSIGELGFFTSAEYEADTQNLAFTTNHEMAIIQIFNSDGELEFQLPVMSDTVKINKNLFGTGEYKLGFMLKGQSQLHTTKVTIKS